jgi:pre-mRNA-processing factor SLU7
MQSTTAPTRMTRDEYKNKKALEEARKAGTVAPEVDEEGRDINPHIPEYISKVPWYIDKDRGPTLSHQRSSLQQQQEPDTWYHRGKRKAEIVTKYRKGACTNCGAMTHKTKDCTERPRKRGAKLTGQDIAQDELVETVQLSYEGKRDRWNGYDPNSFSTVFEHYKEIENERRKKKAAELSQKQQEKLKKQEEKANKLTTEDDSDSDSDIEDEDMENEGAGLTFSNEDPKTKSTIHQLRIREDTAKYLRNLDENSAYYDPKTRSMRENPLPHMDENELVYAGDNRNMRTGEWKDFVQVQRYAWEAQERGQNVNFVGAPSQAELGFKTFKEKQQKLAEERRKAILQQYGEDSMRRPEDDALVLKEKEVFVQFARDGRVVNTVKNIIPKSRYPEDVYEHGHTSVWGSYWTDGQWGYACCKLTKRGAVCPLSDPLELIAGTDQKKQETSSISVPLQQQSNNTTTESSNSDKKRKRKSQEDEHNTKKSKYNSQHGDFHTTDEQLEDYRRNRSRSNDPMSNYVDKDE